MIGENPAALDTDDIRRATCMMFCLLVFFVLSLVLVVNEVAAVVSGPCSDCHTMHNSQGGSSVVEIGKDLTSTDTPQAALLNSDCVGCHSGTNDGSDPTPHVFDDSPTYGDTGILGNTLAGGSFYWVSLALGANDPNNAKGHNVAGLSIADADLPLPPGFGSGLPAADTTIVGDGSGWSSGTQLTCAGVYGCHGAHDQTSATEAVKGGHHGGASGKVLPGASPTAANSYRMLVGIAGYEDPEWEFTPTTSLHNEYKGTNGISSTDDSTISYLCAQCHGTFHQDRGSASPWLRHPTDFDMGSSNRSEYDNYPGLETSGNYSVITPVAIETIPDTPRSVVSVSDAANDAIVTCISCHRAHGTPYYKIMRWDYANGIGGYCVNCHTSKS